MRYQLCYNRMDGPRRPEVHLKIALGFRDLSCLAATWCERQEVREAEMTVTLSPFGDSNPGPSPYHGDALPLELKGH